MLWNKTLKVKITGMGGYTGTTEANIKDNITGIKIAYWHEKDGKTKAVTAGEAGNCKPAAAD